MKQKIKYFSALCAVCAVMLGVAAAAGASRQITATLRPDITVRVDGAVQTITDSTGQETAPIIYNGTTYLPVKSIGQILDREVTWDGKTNTVNITAPAPSTEPDYITREQAVKLAQDRAPNATLAKIEFEEDDGRWVYEGELREGRTEYEFKIDAQSGQFLEWKIDRD